MSGVPQRWSAARFEDLLSYVQRGKSPKYTEKSELPVINQKCIRWWGIQEEHLKYIHPDQIKTWTEERFLQNGDILWNSTGTGTIGRACIFRGIKEAARVVADSHVTILRPNDIVEPDFLFRYISSPAVQERIEDMQTGSTNQVELSKNEILATAIPLPPLPEQRRIVRKLDALSAHSTNARAELVAIKKLVERYKASVLDRIFNSVESDPTTIADVTTFVTSGSRGWAKYYADDGALFIRVGDTQRGSPELSLTDVQHVKPPKDSEGKRTLLQRGDLVVSITADLGRVGVVPEDFGEAYVSQHVALIRPIDPNAAKFIAWYLISPQGQKHLLKNDRGATKAGIGLGDIRDVKIPTLSPTKQSAVVDQIEAAFAKIDRLAAEAQKALKMVDRLDQRILAKAFAGELVPQDPNDEPASVMLERIRAERTATPKPQRPVRKKKAA